MKGGVLFASNHLANVDPPLVGCWMSRSIFYFAKEELFRIPVLGWFITQVNAFPVRRFDHDIGAFKKACGILAAGEGLLLFPEGRRSKTGELGAPKAGIALLAYKARVPVIPVCIQNTDKLQQFKRISLAFGKPIHPRSGAPEKGEYERFSAEIMAAIADLKSKMLYNVPSS